MSSLNNISIATKLALASGLGILLVVLITAAQFINTYRTDAALASSAHEK